MSSFKDIRDFVFVGYAHNMFDDEEFCLLDDFYQSKNPDFPYNLYAHSIWGKWILLSVIPSFESRNGTFPCWQTGYRFPQHPSAHSVPFAMA